MAVYQASGDGRSIQISKGFNDDIACLMLVCAMDFLRRHFASAGNLTVKIISMGGAQGRNTSPHLRKGSGPSAVGMHYAA